MYAIHDGRFIEAGLSCLTDDSSDPRHGGPLINGWQVELVVWLVSVFVIPGGTGSVLGAPGVWIEHETEDPTELAVHGDLVNR